MDIRQLKLTFIGLIILSIIMIGLYYRSDSMVVITKELGQKEMIIDEGQFILKPIIERDKNNIRVIFLVNLTSFQNRDLLSLDYKDQAVLEVYNDTSVYPIQWEIIESDRYKLVGKLIFDFQNKETLSTMLLRLFTFTDNEISWTFE